MTKSEYGEREGTSELQKRKKMNKIRKLEMRLRRNKVGIAQKTIYYQRKTTGGMFTFRETGSIKKNTTEYGPKLRTKL